MAVESLYQKGNDHCITPEWVKQGLFQGWFDPCPLSVWGGTKHQMDGLKVEWENKTFVNPPYSNPLPWIEKAIQENKQGKTIALLVKHDSSTKWFRLLHEANAHFLMFQGRLHFNNCKTAAPFASVLAVLYVKEAH